MDIKGIALGMVLVFLCLGCVASPQVRKVPKVDDIAIDGRADDWADRGFRASLLADQDGNVCDDAEDLDAAFRLGWDERGLLVLVNVRDNVGMEAGTAGIWGGDGVEVFIADAVGGKEKVQVIAAAGYDPNWTGGRARTFDQRSDPELKKTEPNPKVASSTTDTGYTIEMLLPWSDLGVKPEVGRDLGFQIYVNDKDDPGDMFSVVWFPAGETHLDSKRMYAIRLSNTAPPAPTVEAYGKYKDLRKLVVTAVGIAETDGKSVTVTDAVTGRLLVSGRMKAEKGRFIAKLSAPVPKLGERPIKKVVVRVGGKAVSTIDLPDLDRGRALEMINQYPAFQPHVFSGTKFPECRFDNPEFIESLIGPYTLEVTCYDKGYNRVTKAAEPGRYGAIIKIKTEDGRVFTRYRTLYRMPEAIVWWRYEVSSAPNLPPQLGIDPATARKYRADLGEFVKLSMMDHLGRHDQGAVVLAGMSESDAGGARMAFNAPEPRNRQWWVGLRRKLNGNAKKYPGGLEIPRKIEGKPAPVLHKSTMKEAGMAADAPQRIDAVLTEWAKDTDEAFIACVARNGVIVLHKAYGQRDSKPMTVDEPSWMASITKFMQGACIMMLVDQGLVDLDTPIGEYLPAMRKVKHADGTVGPTPITLRHLITHTSGFWGHWGDEDNDLDLRVAEYHSRLEIGKDFLYNGTDLALASKVLQQVSGESLPAFYKRRLLDPLGIKNTTVTNSSYDAKSVAMDMAVFGQMLLNGGAYGEKRFFSELTRDKMLPVKLTMCLGPDTEEKRGVGCVWYPKYFGGRTFGHGSAAAATIRVDLDNNLVVTMTRNSAGKNFLKYHPRFLRVVRECMTNPKNVQPLAELKEGK